MDTQDLFVGIVAPAQWGSALLGRWAIAAEWQDDVVPPACGINHVWRERNARSQRIRSAVPERSEEHTSELQSLMRISYAVFCLKKKNHKNPKSNTTI